MLSITCLYLILNLERDCAWRLEYDIFVCLIMIRGEMQIIHTVLMFYGIIIECVVLDVN